ncbi:unnamed protein product [Cuscuta epithymum]|uniref:BED-type domain-containing protein n=1 Tax=Cuscuta epithymum TaxID=186058 RepID=A0AAV0F1F9_9ASTE|nr:unnamed protein product [Cuscuta epithymum]CAH9129359.1 unnamed protein product [Cuscuta epithymum]
MSTGTGRDPAWEHGDEIKKPGLEGKTYKYVKCRYCGQQTTGGVSRLKNHLAGTRKNVKPCPAVSDKIKNEMLNMLKLSENTKTVYKRNREELIESGSYYQSSNPSAEDSSGVNNSQRGVRGPIDRFVVDVDNENKNCAPVGDKERRQHTCLDVGRFFIENGIPFNVANSPSFINMCRSIGNYGRGFKPPSPYELSHWILDEEVKTAQKLVNEVKVTWTQTGVSILSDGWKDMRGRQLINFLVNNPYGTVFLKSVDASDQVKDAQMLCKLLDSVVEEVGEDIVTQVVTDNASNYKAAGKLLMAKRPHLWWTPCAAHCIDLILEQIGELPQHKNVLAKAKKVTKLHNFIIILILK